MSNQWAIENDTGEELTVRAPNGFAVELDADSADPRERFAYFAIRQQSADIAELRAELNRERETNAVLRRDLADPPPDIQELALKKCGHFEIVTELRAELAAAVAKRNEWAGGDARLSSQLGNLLAVIHRDGGHYEAEHGTEKACADAVQRICDARAGLGAAGELAMLVRRLARALQKAAPDSDLPKTAMDYLSIAGLAGSPMRRDE